MVARHFGSLAVLLAVSAALPAFARPRCPGGRFVVEPSALLATDVPAVDVVVVDGTSVSIGAACGPARVHLRRAARGGVALRARWETCAGVTGAVRLKARVDRACGRMTGLVRARRANVRWRFQATRTPVCGNGIREADEECDQPGDCCSATCRLTDLPACAPAACTADADCAPDAYCARDGGCDGSGVCRPLPEACVGVLDQVCGCDGRTYGNACEAAAARVNVASAGQCGRRCGTILGISCPDDRFCEFPAGTCGAADVGGLCRNRPAACPRNYRPVCGCDDQTYGNDCTRQSAGVAKVHDGPCQCPAILCAPGTRPADPDGDGCIDACLKDCTANTDCEASELCVKPRGACNRPGTCRPRPDFCTQQFDPVCGCDGRTYGNACGAAARGVNVRAGGACPQVCGTIAGLECPDDQLCDLEPGLCHGADIGGVCHSIAPGCIALYDPVCGCDGVTYGNDCERRAQRAQKAHDGRCE